MFGEIVFIVVIFAKYMPIRIYNPHFPLIFDIKVFVGRFFSGLGLTLHVCAISYIVVIYLSIGGDLILCGLKCLRIILFYM